MVQSKNLSIEILCGPESILCCHSYHPVKYKQGLIKSLFNKTDILTSTTTEVNLLNETLKNKYPLKYINLYKGPSKLRPTVLLASIKPIYITLPFRKESNRFVLK